jgi:hypothetical protein
VKVLKDMGQNGDGVRILAKRHNSLRKTEGLENLPVVVAAVPDRNLEKLRDMAQGSPDVLKMAT